MSLRVFAWDKDPIADPFAFSCLQSNRRAALIVEEQQGRFITLPDGRLAVQKFPPKEVLLERAARNCVTSLGRILDKMMDPPALHYEVPAVGDHRLRWKRRFMTYVPVAV